MHGNVAIRACNQVVLLAHRDAHVGISEIISLPLILSYFIGIGKGGSQGGLGFQVGDNRRLDKIYGYHGSPSLNSLSLDGLPNCDS
uniref:Uncharacterized protein n=1 Tax=viral metagenome TaxID=1070528 RepID=A0A6H1Z9F1_9ZZZZ